MPSDQQALAPAAAEHLILAEVTRMLVEIIGEEYVLDLDIGMDTSFNHDLELESIEFVTLSSRLTEHYGGQVDFVAFLADKEVDEIIGMTVGQLVGYVGACLAAAPPAAAPLAAAPPAGVGSADG